MPSARIVCFGDFELDAEAKRLTRKRQPISLSHHQAGVLLQLVAHAGQVVTKDALIESVWDGLAVTDNSVEQVVSSLRKVLGQAGDAAKVIETVPRRGYRFAAQVTAGPVRASDAELDAILQPYRALIDGRAELETLEREAVSRAMQAFEAAVNIAPGYAAPHVGLANALVMQFESTRADHAPDGAALARAAEHAREACRLDPDSGDAWATLALVLHHTQQGTQALAAARRAVAIEPRNWQHHVRLAYVAWGEERLRAAHRALALFPGFALAHWLAATVYVARGALDLAERDLRAGAAAQDAQKGAGAFASVGCHWLLGLVHLCRRDEAGALEAFERELSHEGSGQLYGRECAANSWHAIGAVHLRHRRLRDAGAAFEEALARVPSHVPAAIGRQAARSAADDGLQTAQIARQLAELTVRRPFDAAMARAAAAVAAGRVDEGASILEQSLANEPDGSAGWSIPVDPILDVHAQETVFARVLARLRARAG